MSTLVLLMFHVQYDNIIYITQIKPFIFFARADRALKILHRGSVVNGKDVSEKRLESLISETVSSNASEESEEEVGLARCSRYKFGDDIIASQVSPSECLPSKTRHPSVPELDGHTIRLRRVDHVLRQLE